MIVKKFSAPTTREALRQVRDVLGPDALILSNRPVPGGVEIMAVAEADVASLTGAVPPSRPAARHEIPGVTVPRAPAEKPAPPANEAGPSPTAQRPPTASPAPEAVVQSLVQELKTIRMMLEGQLAGFA
jgi:flagellar biosynthesis protein FlhF